MFASKVPRIRTTKTWCPPIVAYQALKYQSTSVFRVNIRFKLQRTKCCFSTTTTDQPILSPRKQAQLEEQILSVANIKDPFLLKPIRSWLKSVSISDDQWTIHVKIPNLRMHPDLDGLRQAIKHALESSPLAAPQITVNFTSMPSPPWIPQQSRDYNHTAHDNISPALAGTTHILPVYSCKGGVGKSTVALNLAYTMAHLGIKVGLLDLDVFGPSLPTLLQLDTQQALVSRSPLAPGMVYPIIHSGVKLLSLGYVSSKSGVPNASSETGAAIMRGPMASRVASQLIKGTDWGELDVLILDLPPGTGDVQLTTCQELHHVTGAVGITTPSKLALVDVRKGIQMFESLNIPTLAVVENMSYFQCEHGTKYYPFGQGLRFDKRNPAEFAQHLGVSSSSCGIFQLPLSQHTTDSIETGIPLCLARPLQAEQELQVYDDMAKFLVKQMFAMQNGTSFNNTSNLEGVMFDSQSTAIFHVASALLKANEKSKSFTLRFFSNTDGVATQVDIPAHVLRMTHPKTGERMDDRLDDMAKTLTSPSTSSGCSTAVHVHREHMQPQPPQIKLPKLFPVTLERKGQFGYSVEWADGATINYSMASLAKAAGGKLIPLNRTP